MLNQMIDSITNIPTFSNKNKGRMKNVVRNITISMCRTSYKFIYQWHQNQSSNEKKTEHSPLYFQHKRCQFNLTFESTHTTFPRIQLFWLMELHFTSASTTGSGSGSTSTSGSGVFLDVCRVVKELIMLVKAKKKKKSLRRRRKGMSQQILVR